MSRPNLELKSTQTLSGSGAGIFTPLTSSTYAPVADGIYFMHVLNIDNSANVYIVPNGTTATGSYSALLCKADVPTQYGPFELNKIPYVETDSAIDNTVYVSLSLIISAG